MLTCLLASVCWGQEKVGDYYEQDGIMYIIKKIPVEGDKVGRVIVTHLDSVKTGNIMKYNVERKYEGVITLHNEIYIELNGERYKYDIVGIDSHAFEDCPNLIFVMLSEFTDFIGERAFYNCKWLQVADLTPFGIRFVGKEAFANCRMLSFVKVANHARFGNKVFSDCTNISAIVLEKYNKIEQTPICPIDMFDKSILDKAKLYYYGDMNIKEFVKGKDCWQQFRYIEFKKSSSFDRSDFEKDGNLKTFYYMLTGEKFLGRLKTPVVTPFDYSKVKDTYQWFFRLENYRHQ